jgi:hypothetical protein
LSGDFNNDGSVDAADYVVWRKRGLVPTTPENYNTWRTNFGETTGGGGDGIAESGVPEPSRPMLLILPAISVLHIRRSFISR